MSQDCSCRFLRVRKSLPQVFEICRRIRIKMILRGPSGKNIEKNSPIENKFIVFMRFMLIPDLIDGFITWQSTLPCRANQGNSVRGRTGFSIRGVCGQAFPFLPSPPPPPTFLCSPQFSHFREAKNASNLRKALRKCLLRRLTSVSSRDFQLFVHFLINVP